MSKTLVFIEEETTYVVTHTEDSHNHDNRYYTESEIDDLLSNNTTFSTNYSYSGSFGKDIVGENVHFGDFLYKKMSDGKWYKAKANSITTIPCRRMALATATADTECLLLYPGGTVRNDSWDWIDDGTIVELWLSASVAGGVTEFLDTSEGAFGQVIATPLASNIIEFCASLPVARF